MHIQLICSMIVKACGGVVYYINNDILFKSNNYI